MEWKTYGIYHARWQASTLVMAVPTTVLSWHLPSAVALAISQVIGACLFWYFDKRLFSEEEDG